MATTRKDLRGRILRKGEMQRSSDKRYKDIQTTIGVVATPNPKRKNAAAML